MWDRFPTGPGTGTPSRSEPDRTPAVQRDHLASDVVPGRYQKKNYSGNLLRCPLPAQRDARHQLAAGFLIVLVGEHRDAGGNSVDRDLGASSRASDRVILHTAALEAQ